MKLVLQIAAGVFLAEFAKFLVAYAIVTASTPRF